MRITEGDDELYAASVAEIEAKKAEAPTKFDELVSLHRLWCEYCHGSRKICEALHIGRGINCTLMASIQEVTTLRIHTRAAEQRIKELEEAQPIEKLEAHNRELTNVVLQFLQWLENGELVRDVSKDTAPKWATRMMAFVLKLNQARDAVGWTNDLKVVKSHE